MSDRALALELDRALDGAAAGEEARALAALLVAAAEPVRVDVTEAEIETALARARPPVPERRRRLVPMVGLALVAAAATAVTLVRTGGPDVEAHAAAAVEATYFVDADVVPAQPRLFPATEVTGLVDGSRGRAHVHVYSRVTGTVAETVLQPDGRVERWLARTNTITLAATCDALPGGCGETFDPFALYVRSLERGDVATRKLDGGYELRLRAGRVEQIATLSATTYLPRMIEWRQDGRLVATIRFATLDRRPGAQPADAFTMSPHPGARVIQVAHGGRPVRVERVTAARVRPGLRWLGPIYRGAPARVADVRLTGGRATRISYGRVVVWNYREIEPPQIVGAHALAAKVFALRDGSVAHVYFGRAGLQIAVVSYGRDNVAVASAGGDNLDVVEAIQRLRRAGSA